MRTGMAVRYPIAKWMLDRTAYPVVFRLIMPRDEATESGSEPSSSSSFSSKPGQRRGGSEAATTSERDKMRKRVFEALWKLSCYGLFMSLALSYVVSQPWFWDTRLYWHGWPQQEGG